jgi:hypothetical protein
VQLLKFLVDYLTKVIVVAVPLYGKYLADVPGLGGLRDDTNRAAVAVGLFTTLFLFQTRDAYVTAIGVDDFLRDYVKELDLGIPGEHWGADLRMNVMYIRRAWWSLFLLRAFEMRGRKGFDTPGVVHADERLVLLSWQGVAGQALKGQPIAVSQLPAQPTWRIWDALWMFPWQVRATLRVKAILAVPMVHDAKGRRRVVGVVNLDAISDAGVAYIQQHQKVLVRTLAGLGKYLARLP